MNKAVKSIFILAGEPSADIIGAELVAELHKREKKLHFLGVGGERLGQSFSSIFPMNDLSVMGFSDVIKKLPKLLFRARQVTKYILAKRPDIVILIDSQEFSKTIAKALRKNNFSNPIILYVAPTVWAWKPHRAPILAKYIDEIFALFPFEVEVIRSLNGPKTSYVGHPTLKLISPIKPSLQDNKGALAIYPGSRMGEITRHLPVFEKIAKKLASNKNINSVILPTLPHLEKKIKKIVANWEIDVIIIADEKQKQLALNTTKLAIISAGTISLELALAHIPMIATYIPDRLQLFHYNRAGKPFICLPNILLKREVVAEIFPDKNLHENLYSGANILLNDKKAREKQIFAFQEMRKILAEGENNNRQEAAERVLSYL